MQIQKKKVRSFLSTLLSLAMLMSLIGVPAFAAPPEDDAPVVVSGNYTTTNSAQTQASAWVPMDEVIFQATEEIPTNRITVNPTQQYQEFTGIGVSIDHTRDRKNVV